MFDPDILREISTDAVEISGTIYESRTFNNYPPLEGEEHSDMLGTWIDKVDKVQGLHKTYPKDYVREGFEYLVPNREEVIDYRDFKYEWLNIPFSLRFVAFKPVILYDEYYKPLVSNQGLLLTPTVREEGDYAPDTIQYVFLHGPAGQANKLEEHSTVYPDPCRTVYHPDAEI